MMTPDCLVVPPALNKCAKASSLLCIKACVSLCVFSCRYASLYFCCAIEEQDNELITLEVIHRFVELLDKYFGSVCELDIIFNFEKAYFILDEFLMGGEIQDTSKKSVLKAIEQADLLQEEDESPRSVLEEMGLA
ncbi:AP-1 complex subunit sigma-1A-like [Xyrichtys novacula]|uniref:AP-1 complex subunit sigma-1A-like n=1 Tax=Xyrichtys novacula TaxID=13765 RepID=A0AAV1HK84_XYRNO|nr:AP-1 complex subunit sigma-1A-like [Xyrichtys novacula]